MSSVWKHPSSPYWTGIYIDEAGKKRRFSTKKKRKREAELMVQDLEDIAAQAREQSISEQAFLKETERMRARRFGGKLKTFREFVKGWLETKDANNSENTGTRYKIILNRFIGSLSKRADAPISSIEPADCQGHIDRIARLGNAAASLALEITVLRSVFNSAMKQRLIAFNPASAIDPPRKIRQVQRKTFTPEQIAIIIKQASSTAPEWVTATLLGYYCGARLGDCALMRWDSIDMSAGIVRYQSRKTGEFVTVPLHPVLQQHLLDIAGDSSGPIMPTLAATRVTGANGLSQQFMNLMRDAGIGRQFETVGKRKLSTLSFHSLRKTFNSEMHGHGVSQELRKKIVGHKSDSVNDRYTATQLSQIREAINTVPKVELP